MGFEGARQIAKCENCGKDTDISNSSFLQKLLVQLKTEKERNKLFGEKVRRIHLSKNGQIQSMHRKIGAFMKLMTPEQKKKARKINQSFRDELRKLEKSL